MPKKIDLLIDGQEVQGYKEGVLAVFQRPDNKLWTVIHHQSMSPVVGTWSGWKQKRQAVAYATELQNHGLNFDCLDAKDFQQKNSDDARYDAFMAAFNKAKEL